MSFESVRCVQSFEQKVLLRLWVIYQVKETPAHHAFATTGVDYAGPYLLRPIKGRSPKLFKCYIALFICFATRAIHLELVSDLTTDSFLAALRRFISDHIKPIEIYSDCGSNFIDANREMKDFLALVKSEPHSSTVDKVLSQQGIQWRFNPPSAPHMGGLWEAGVKSTKYHLKRVVGSTPLNYEEFHTLLKQVQACLNSRPLCQISSHPDDLTALTPGHFVAGGPPTALTEPSYDHLKLNRLSKWQLVQRLNQHFWQRWSAEYLTRLQARPKWWSHQPNFEVGNLVLVKDERLPPQQWHLAR
ncbi:unnamed protein product [Allacma fusca]|uniref:Integrase catalytic domain-containing protein n=1 Tax=Allacma fusca TaxID=39272 RepID=A0A8J2K8M0_9HEXA|nr:unnamed protein product [Allacma fusca]